MRNTRKKSFRKSGDYIEVSIPMNASYHVVCREAAETFHMVAPYEGCSLKLFRVDGTVVSNRPIKTAFGLQPWTIDRYMSLLQRSVSQVKLGVGFVENEMDVSVSNLFDYVYIMVMSCVVTNL